MYKYLHFTDMETELKAEKIAQEHIDGKGRNLDSNPDG